MTETAIRDARILFVGGQEQYIKKMKNVYPDWTYLSMSERNTSKVKGNFDAVVIKNDHVSHNIVEKVMKYCKDTPVVYCKYSNVDRSIDEIKKCMDRFNVNLA